MAGHAPFTWLSYLPFIGGLDHQVSGALFVLLLLSLLSYFAFRKIALQTPMDVVPSGRLTLRNFFELFTEMILQFLDDIIGHRGREFLPHRDLGLFHPLLQPPGAGSGFPAPHG